MKSRNIQAAGFAAVLATVQALPWVMFVLAGVSFITSANESIAYRYFHSYRLIQGEAGTIWLPQGQTLGLLQTLIQYMLNWAGIVSLRERIELFGVATLGVNSLVFAAAVFFIARSKAVSRERLMILATVAIYAIFGSRWGVFAARLPDYYTWEATLTVLCLGLFFANRDLEVQTAGSIRIAALGALAGAMIGIKLTLIPAAFLPMLPILLNSLGKPGRIIDTLVRWCAAATAALGLIVAAYYHFDFAHMSRAFTAWRTFVSDPGSEPDFIRNLFGPITDNPSSDHRFVWVVIVLWIGSAARYALATVGTARGGAKRRALLAAYILVTSALHVVAVMKRPAETTLFETALYLAVAAGIMVGIETEPRRNARAAITWSAIAILWSAVSAIRFIPTISTLRILRDSSSKAWDLHSWISASGRPALVYIPDNGYISDTVEDALMKGFSDVPTWKITTGYRMLGEILPNLRFTQELTTPPPDHLLMWTDLPEKPSLAATNPAIGTILRLHADSARSWTLRRPPVSRTVTIVPTETTAEAESLPVIVGSDRWRNGTPGNPIRGFSVSPAEASPRIELRSESDRTFIRLTATRSSGYLALTGFIPEVPDGTGPLRVRAVVRTDPTREIVTQFYDIVGADGANESPRQSIASPAGVWTTHLIDKPTVRFPTPSDNFSVGILDVSGGDVLDVEVLELRGPK